MNSVQGSRRRNQWIYGVILGDDVQAFGMNSGPIISSNCMILVSVEIRLSRVSFLVRICYMLLACDFG